MALVASAPFLPYTAMVGCIVYKPGLGTGWSTAQRLELSLLASILHSRFRAPENAPPQAWQNGTSSSPQVLCSRMLFLFLIGLLAKQIHPRPNHQLRWLNGHMLKHRQLAGHQSLSNSWHGPILNQPIAVLSTALCFTQVQRCNSSAESVLPLLPQFRTLELCHRSVMTFRPRKAPIRLGVPVLPRNG